MTLATMIATSINGAGCLASDRGMADDLARALGPAVAEAMEKAMAEMFKPDLYVSPNGRAEWSGRVPTPNADATDGPLPSIAAARDHLRELRAANALADELIVVAVAPGTYFLEEPLVFGPRDGAAGEDGAVLYVAGEGDHADFTGRLDPPVISGGRKITGWRTVEINGHPAWATEIPEVKSGSWNFRQLFVNAERRPRTRLPREGFYHFTGLPEVTPQTTWNVGQTKASFRPDDIKPWKNLGEVDVVALHFWIESRMPIAELDAAANVVTFKAPSTFRLTGAHGAGEFAPYYVENVFEALDEPGEWYLDRPGGTLYYLPKPGETPENATVIAPKLDQLVRIEGEDGNPVRSLGFANLAFAHAGYYWPEGKAGSGQAAFEVPGAIHLAKTERCGLVQCRVSQLSNYAVEVDAGCKDIGIDNCVLTDLGAGGVKIGHGSERTTVTHCDIGPGGRIFHSAVGVWIGRSSYNTVSHNEIHDLYYTGVSVGWSWGYAETSANHNAIEYNHIHHIGKGWLSDMAGIYTLGVSPGTVLRYNRIHDIEAAHYGGWGLYNDEGSTGILLENNVVYRTTHGGYHQHYGKENVIRNNVLAFSKNAQVMRSREEDHLSFTFERNIVYFTEGTLLGSTWANDHFKLDNNVYWRVGGQPFDFLGQSLDQWRARGHDVHSIVADPLFVDPQHDDFSLKPGSPALDLGFQPIDTSQIGRMR